MDKFLEGLRDARALAGMLLALGYLVVSNVDLRCQRDDLEDRAVQLGNDLADADTLKQVLGDSVNVLKERYARQEKDLNETLNEKSLLAKRLKEKDGQLLATAELLAETRLEKIRLEGRVDSTGYKADFAETNEYYTLTASVNLKPTPVMDIHELLLVAPITVGIYTSEGYVSGAVETTNPYVQITNSTFRVPIQSGEETLWDTLQPYVLGGGIGVLVVTLIHAQ